MSIRTALIAISCYLEAKFDYGYFIFFLRCGSKILHKKFQVILSKNEGVTLIFPIALSAQKLHSFEIAIP